MKQRKSELVESLDVDGREKNSTKDLRNRNNETYEKELIKINLRHNKYLDSTAYETDVEQCKDIGNQ